MSSSDAGCERDAKRRHIADDQNTHAARSTTGAGDSLRAEATVEMPAERATPAEAAAQAPPLVAGSPSKVHGGRLLPGASSWVELAMGDGLAVDKSAAILDVMNHSESVVIGLYPRRMGKSLFLGLLEDFLGVVSDTPYRDRRTKYKQYAIYEEDPKFFEDNIGRHPVFKLDLKEHGPKTRNEAAKHLRMTVLAASGRHVDILRQLVEGKDVEVGAHDLATVRERLDDHHEIVARAIKLYDNLEERKDISADDLPNIGAVLPALMEAFSRLLGHDAVVVIDECDAPFINTLCDVKDRDLRFQLFGVYGSFLSGILKGNPYLYKGVLAGVFDVLRSGVGSGLNNSVTFLAHSGFVDRQTNPFERAFGFTAPDVQGAINRYVDKLWPGRGGCPNVDEFKARVFSGLLAQCGGYRVGTVHRIFCPLAVMRSLAWLRQVKTSAEVSLKGLRIWEETGRLTMFRPIKEGSLEDLQRYLSHLTAEFHRQQEFQRTSPAMVRLETASSLDDGAVVQIASQPSEQNELAYGDDTEAQLVKICTDDRVGVIDDLGVGEELTAATVVQLIYQGGYMAQVSNDRMSIPSEGVLNDIMVFYTKLTHMHKLSGNIGDYMARRMGVSDCDMQTFAASMQTAFAPLHGLGEKTSESTYEMHVCQFLATFIPAGYMVIPQVKERAGISDTHMYTGPGATTDTPTCFIFQCRNYDRAAADTDDERVTAANREQVAKRQWERAKGAIQQIDDRYFKSATRSLAGFKRVLLFGMALWQSRFVMIVTQRRKQEDAKNVVTWPPVAFTHRDGAGVDDIQGLDYADLGDNLGVRDGVRTFVRGGHFIAITI